LPGIPGRSLSECSLSLPAAADWKQIGSNEAEHTGSVRNNRSRHDDSIPFVTLRDENVMKDLRV